MLAVALQRRHMSEVSVASRVLDEHHGWQKELLLEGQCNAHVLRL